MFECMFTAGEVAVNGGTAYVPNASISPQQAVSLCILFTVRPPGNPRFPDIAVACVGPFAVFQFRVFVKELHHRISQAPQVLGGSHHNVRPTSKPTTTISLSQLSDSASSTLF